MGPYYQEINGITFSKWVTNNLSLWAKVELSLEWIIHTTTSHNSKEPNKCKQETCFIDWLVYQEGIVYHGNTRGEPSQTYSVQVLYPWLTKWESHRVLCGNYLTTNVYVETWSVIFSGENEIMIGCSFLSILLLWTSIKKQQSLCIQTVCNQHVYLNNNVLLMTTTRFFQQNEF